MPSDLPYDVFMSYRHTQPDRDWVRGRLVPALRAATIRVCIDHEDFRLGAPLVTEMGRAVEQSRFTLAVLSPAYLESTFTTLESVIAEHLGLETAAIRLLLVMRENCAPPLTLRSRLWLDMSDDASFESGIRRLANEILPAPGD